MGNTAYFFISAYREGLAAAIDSLPDNAKRASITVSIKSRAHVLGGDEGAFSTFETSKVLEIQGPGEIDGILNKSLFRVEPSFHTCDFEPNYFPFLEIKGEPDFPWRYSTQPADISTSGVFPCIALIVLEYDEQNENESEFIDVKRTTGVSHPFIIVKDECCLPDLDSVELWTHVQISGEESDTPMTEKEILRIIRQQPERAVCRLMCPRRLEPKTSYRAFVVPTYKLGIVAAGIPVDDIAKVSAKDRAWSKDEKNIKLPYYFSWDFSTSEQGDFEHLLRMLKPRKLTGLGLRTIDCSKPGVDVYASDRAIGVSDAYPMVIEMEGALESCDTNYSSWGNDAEKQVAGDKWSEHFQSNLAAVLHKAGNRDGPVLLPPLYGSWIQNNYELDPNHKTRWFEWMNLDPRHRAAAGNGALAFRKRQNEFMASAFKQLGPLLKVNALLERAQAARESSRRTYEEIKKLDLNRFFRLTAPVHNRTTAGVSSINGGTGRKTVRSIITEHATVINTLTDPSFRRISQPNGPIRKRNRSKKSSDLIARAATGRLRPSDPSPFPGGALTLCIIAQMLKNKISRKYGLLVSHTEGGCVEVQPPVPKGGFDFGKVITLYAKALDDYTFVKWRNRPIHSSTDVAISFRIEDEYSIEAVFTRCIPKFKLEIVYDESFGDDVVSSETCPDMYFEEGTEITLEALPAEKRRLMKWIVNTCERSFEEEIDVIISEDICIEARFGKMRYSLEVNTLGVSGGCVEIGDTEYTCKTLQYDVDTKVTLLAKPQEKFTHWDGDSITSICKTSNPLVIEMTNDHFINAYFEEPPKFYRLMVKETFGGSISCTPKEDKYAEGTKITLEAVPEYAYEFVKWAGVPAHLAKQRVVSFEVFSDRMVSAKFRLKKKYQFKYSVLNGQGGMIYADPKPKNGRLPKDTVVTLTAKEDEGYQFKKWYGHVPDASNHEIKITVNRNYDIEAYFQKNEHKLLLEIGKGGIVYLVNEIGDSERKFGPTDDFDRHEIITREKIKLKAVPIQPLLLNRFSHWRCQYGTSPLSFMEEKSARITLDLSSDCCLRAVFKPIQNDNRDPMLFSSSIAIREQIGTRSLPPSQVLDLMRICTKELYSTELREELESSDPFVGIAEHFGELISGSSKVGLEASETWLAEQTSEVIPATISDEALNELRDEVLEQLNPEHSFLEMARGMLDTAHWLRNRLVVTNDYDPLDPIYVSPEFPDPMYKLLEEMGLDYVLPGGGRIPQNSIGLLSVNRRFIESFMCGLNHEFIRACLCKSYPVNYRSLPFRQFWDVSGYCPIDSDMNDLLREWLAGLDREKWLKQDTAHPPTVHDLTQEKREYLIYRFSNTIADIVALNRMKEQEVSEYSKLDEESKILLYEIRHQNETVVTHLHLANDDGLISELIETVLLVDLLKDVAPASEWKEKSLGELGNRENEGLILMIRGNLLRRYPDTRIYAVGARRINHGGTTVLRPELEEYLPEGQTCPEPILPVFRGFLEPDISFVGFDMSVEKALGEDGELGVYFVLQEEVGRTRFGLDSKSADKLESWDYLSWEDFPWETNKKHLDKSQPTRTPTCSSKHKWASCSATNAWITLQKPFRVAVHAKRMIKRGKD